MSLQSFFFIVVVDRRVLDISHMKMENNSASKNEEIKLTVWGIWETFL